MTPKPQQAATDRKHVDMIEQGGTMNNAQMTQAFLSKYRTEIDALIADLHLQDKDIRILEGTPDEAELLGRDPEDMVTTSSCWSAEVFEDTDDWGYAIRFGWYNIIDDIDELHYGLVSLAFCLRGIWQKYNLRGGAWHNTIAPQLIPYDAMSHDLHVYSYEAVYRLFGLFSREEIKEILSENDECKWCQAIERKPLRLIWPESSVLSA